MKYVTQMDSPSLHRPCCQIQILSVTFSFPFILWLHQKEKNCLIKMLLSAQKSFMRFESATFKMLSIQLNENL